MQGLMSTNNKANKSKILPKENVRHDQGQIHDQTTSGGVDVTNVVWFGPQSAVGTRAKSPREASLSRIPRWLAAKRPTGSSVWTG